MVTLGRRAYDAMYRFGAPWEGADRVELRALVRDGRCSPAALRRAGEAVARAIDLGCGSGSVSLELAEAGFDVTGVDFSRVALAKARAATARRGLGVDRVRFVEADLRAGALAGVEGAFDLLVDYGTLDDLDEGGRRSLAGLMARLARPGARLFLFAFAGRPEDLPRFSFGGPSRTFPGLVPGEVERLFEPAFTVEALDRPSRERPLGTWLLTRSEAPAPAPTPATTTTHAKEIAMDDISPGMRRAGTLLLWSGGLAAVGIGALFAMYAGFAVGATSAALAFGWVNDTLAIVQLALMVPAVLEVNRLVGRLAPRARTPLLVAALGSIAAVAILQGLLITNVLTFEQEIGPVLIGYLGLATWFIATARIGGPAGIVPGGTRTGAMAALYLGFPVWALRVARRLRGGPTPQTVVRRPKPAPAAGD